ncbi:putative iron-regulated membrane protein [Algoriphagus iocasae]|uniref:Putative iron-regulated membrane protein n=1 Tax=Algoriphagus iocasae TaxID=1836499 RepID=A0A841MGQ2_9BACT|nr:PepSY-associated TM helix domain-containing protein [Algoriphagus iocasae]MBB6327362.1 putative iron-regulated membrane protein [Algoriphagus iocasae]
MTFRKFIASIHLYLGLITGFLFFIIALSGAIYTWQPEFSRIAFHQEVKPEDQPFISISDIKNTLQKNFPEGDFRTALYRDPASAIEVLIYVPGTYYHAYLNPYSAELIHLQDMNQGWISKLKNLHRNLLLGPPGREIVHWVTLIAMIMLMTGLVIWWPYSGKPGKEKFTVKWSASPKKLNYDLHNILGFYATWILIFTIGTGIFWGFEVVRESLKEVTGENALKWDSPLSIVQAGSLNSQDEVLNKLIKDYHSRYPEAEVRINIPHKEDEAVQLSAIQPKAGINAVDFYYHDQYTGALIEGNFQNGASENRSTFSKINGLVYDIHFGSVWGMPGRILACLASLIGASLPITGFLVWWNKRKLKRKKR